MPPPTTPDPTGGLDAAAVDELLTRGEITVEGRLRDASNATLYCRIAYEGVERECVWKPVAGERPLWDFPDGTLAGREVATYALSEALGWNIVPPTVHREGPYGPGMCQLWMPGEPGEGLVGLTDGPEPEPGWLPIAQVAVDDGEGGQKPALLCHLASEPMRRIAVFDAVVNNADRKGGHLLPGPDGHVYGIDHGICLHTENKLRTLLWGWADEPLTDEALEALRGLRDALTTGLDAALAAHLTKPEVEAVGARVARLLDTGRHPLPTPGRRPAVPWPLI
ncbi:SCO1664 family protein [Yinghuangia seranimata]|uniref:SCO1664 family protein n=1 Tax=Yinghuangia seranimata TaxID=408067 RepID=UPI00248C3961|nr:SCO1664 family protein [Yinghuangia seranimata]MDI2130175.1 SCO1664 family protein [Yinghuangia seranimata]